MTNVQAIIVTYHPELKVVDHNIKQLLKNKILNAIHIVDNTPCFTNISSLVSDEVTVTELGDNKGIAFAQNAGINKAIKSNADYVILFDQDSDLEPDLISGLLQAMEDSKKSQLNLACIGPRPFDIFSGKNFEPKAQLEKKVNPNITLCSQIIASGKLIDVKALNVIGLMEDSLFIDCVDHEWCWRAKSHGYQIAIAEKVIMEHKLGDARDTFLGISYKIGSPIRMYYQFRNILVLSRRGYVPLYWKLRCLAGMFSRFIVFGFFTKDSSIRRKYMLRGFIDGLIKRMGIFIDR